MPAELEVKDYVHDFLLLHKQEDETMEETLERLLGVLPAPRETGGSLGLTEEPLVLERLPDEDGEISTRAYDSAAALRQARRECITTLQSTQEVDNAGSP